MSGFHEPEGAPAPGAASSIEEDMRQELWDVKQQEYFDTMKEAVSSGVLRYRRPPMIGWSVKSSEPHGAD